MPWDVIDVEDVEDEYHSTWVGVMGFKTIRDLPIYYHFENQLCRLDGSYS